MLIIEEKSQILLWSCTGDISEHSVVVVIGSETIGWEDVVIIGFIAVVTCVVVVVAVYVVTALEVVKIWLVDIGLAVVVICVVVVNGGVTESSFSPGRYAPLDKLFETAKNCDQ